MYCADLRELGLRHYVFEDSTFIHILQIESHWSIFINSKELTSQLVSCLFTKSAFSDP